MALPQDFWQNEHMFHRFRSKPCQRLLRSGICEWHSQCQFSHDLEWPRRPPTKHNYTPALCPHLRVSYNSTGEVQIENTCPNGLACAFSHTKDEVLYHPSIFKTMLCEEHRSLTSDQRSARRSKHRPRCHRYYCPFAHGKLELRTSSLTPEQREAVVRSLGIFPSGGCCGVCTRNTMGHACMENSCGMTFPSTMQLGQEAQSSPWPTCTQPLLSQMVLPRSSPENTSSDMSHVPDPHVWNQSSWLQHSLQQTIEEPKLPAHGQLLHGQSEAPALLHSQPEAPAQETDSLDLDVESEIYGRALRFIEELSTEESDPEDQVSKGDSDCLPAFKDWGSNSESLTSIWNDKDKKAWVAEANGLEGWQPANYWTTRTINQL